MNNTTLESTNQNLENTLSVPESALGIQNLWNPELISGLRNSREAPSNSMERLGGLLRLIDTKVDKMESLALSQQYEVYTAIIEQLNIILDGLEYKSYTTQLKANITKLIGYINVERTVLTNINEGEIDDYKGRANQVYVHTLRLIGSLIDASNEH